MEPPIQFEQVGTYKLNGERVQLLENNALLILQGQQVSLAPIECPESSYVFGKLSHAVINFGCQQLSVFAVTVNNATIWQGSRDSVIVVDLQQLPQAVVKNGAFQIDIELKKMCFIFSDVHIIDFGGKVSIIKVGTQSVSNWHINLLNDEFSHVHVQTIAEQSYISVKKVEKWSQSSISSPIDFDGNQNLVSALENQKRIIVVALNSHHLFYCQIMFITHKSSIGSCFKTANLIKADDSPPVLNRTGRQSLEIIELQWTHNDAFVLVLFTTGALAVLPRLASSFIKVMNPTRLNFSQELQHHYGQARMFNEINLKDRQRLSLQMSSSDDHILLLTKSVAVSFLIKFEPELVGLFSEQNQAFYYLRFCLSMHQLASDEEVIEKIPYLLTNKLPLYEFQKNEIRFENEEESAATRVVTCSQINPWKQDDRHMETNQSFDQEFFADPERVLYNLKQVFFAFRWSSEFTPSHQQWLLNVTNDCFFYFLRCSEHVYAYHCLQMAEYYFQLMTAPNKQSLVTNPHYEIYQQAKQKQPDFCISSATQHHAPVKISFQRQYSLLTYYCLIQFRNYQSSNFNILFLVFACYVVQRHINTSFMQCLLKMQRVVQYNDKGSQDQEFFCTKANRIERPPSKLDVYRQWLNKYLILTGQFSALFLQESYLEVLNEITITQDPKMFRHLGEELQQLVFSITELWQGRVVINETRLQQKSIIVATVCLTWFEQQVKGRKVALSVLGLQRFITRQSIWFDKKVNCINQNTSQMLKYFSVLNGTLLPPVSKEYLATCFVYLGDVSLAAQTIPNTPYLLYLLYRAFNTLCVQSQVLTELLKEFEQNKHVKMIARTSERLNNFYNLKYVGELIRQMLGTCECSLDQVTGYAAVLEYGDRDRFVEMMGRKAVVLAGACIQEELHTGGFEVFNVSNISKRMKDALQVLQYSAQSHPEFKPYLTQYLIYLSGPQEFRHLLLASKVCPVSQKQSMYTQAILKLESANEQDVRMIDYTLLNRQNKQLLNSIKDQSVHKEVLGFVLYDAQPQDSTNAFDLICSQETINFLEQIPTPELRLDSKLLGHCKTMKAQFMMDMDTSLFFRGMSYEQRVSNILGVCEDVLSKGVIDKYDIMPTVKAVIDHYQIAGIDLIMPVYEKQEDVKQSSHQRGPSVVEPEVVYGKIGKIKRRNSQRRDIGVGGVSKLGCLVLRRVKQAFELIRLKRFQLFVVSKGDLSVVSKHKVRGGAFKLFVE